MVISYISFAFITHLKNLRWKSGSFQLFVIVEKKFSLIDVFFILFVLRSIIISLHSYWMMTLYELVTWYFINLVAFCRPSNTLFQLLSDSHNQIISAKAKVHLRWSPTNTQHNLFASVDDKLLDDKDIAIKHC